MMTLILVLLSLAVGFVVGRTTSFLEVAKGQASDFSWPGKPLRYVDLEPTEFSHDWEHRS